MFEEDNESKFLRYALIAIGGSAALWLGCYVIRSAQNTADMKALDEALRKLPKP